jgi:U6 snRNA-associated Sm-like protein LSm6
MSSGASEGKSPADFLKAIKGKKVSVKLNSGVDYRGTHAVVVGAFERCDCPDADG